MQADHAVSLFSLFIPIPPCSPERQELTMSFIPRKLSSTMQAHRRQSVH